MTIEASTPAMVREHKPASKGFQGPRNAFTERSQPKVEKMLSATRAIASRGD
jgi:hypothetical protein